MKAASKRLLRDTVAKYGATIHDQTDGGADSGCINIESPIGFRWLCDDIHELIGWIGYGGTIPRGEVYADLVERMRYGLEKCPADCKWCITTKI